MQILKINCHVEPNISKEHCKLRTKKMTSVINELLQKLLQSEN